MVKNKRPNNAAAAKPNHTSAQPQPPVGIPQNGQSYQQPQQGPYYQPAQAGYAPANAQRQVPVQFETYGQQYANPQIGYYYEAQNTQPAAAPPSSAPQQPQSSAPQSPKPSTAQKPKPSTAQKSRPLTTSKAKASTAPKAKPAAAPKTKSSAPKPKKTGNSKPKQGTTDPSLLEDRPPPANAAPGESNGADPSDVTQNGSSKAHKEEPIAVPSTRDSVRALRKYTDFTNAEIFRRIGCSSSNGYRYMRTDCQDPVKETRGKKRKLDDAAIHRTLEMIDEQPPGEKTMNWKDMIKQVPGLEGSGISAVTLKRAVENAGYYRCPACSRVSKIHGLGKDWERDGAKNEDNGHDHDHDMDAVDGKDEEAAL